jgi:putative protein-disulfide isomerase
MVCTLHYIHDPLCGWCYGAEPLVRAAESVDGLAVELHGGGLWPQPTRLPESTRRYIQDADARIASISGQPFGEPYLRGLLLDPTMVLDSRPTIAAVLVAESIDPTRALPLLRAIQHAHYEQGRRVVEHDVLCDIAAESGLPPGDFAALLGQVPVDEHIAATRRLMSRVGSQGFPTFALQIGDDWQIVPSQRYASDAAGFAAWLKQAIGEAARAPLEA